MSEPLELPPLHGSAERARRRRLLLATLGTVAFVAAAVAVPLALAGGDGEQRGPATRRRGTGPTGRPPEPAPAAPPAVAAPPAPGPAAALSPGSGGDIGSDAVVGVGVGPGPGAIARRADTALDRADLLIKRGTVEGAGTLSGVLKRHGLGAAEAHELAEALDGTFDVRRARPEHAYVLRIDPPTKKLQSFTYRVSASEIYDVVRSARGSLSAAKRQIPVERIHLGKGARVSSSLFEAATRAGLRSVIVGTIAEILSNEVDFYAQQRAGDTFRVIVDEERVEGTFQRYGPILALDYEGEKAGRLKVYRFGSAEEGGYYTSAGRSVEREYLRSPLKFVRVTSEFNPRRMHPILHRVTGHMGVDLAAPTGTPVYASSPGTILSRGDGGAGGNMVQIQHADGLVTIYAHLSRFEPGQSVGTRVEQRQVIGYVGATGRATGPHLHYGMKKNGRFIDPLNFEVRPGRPVPRDRMEEFRRTVARMDRELAAIDPR